jgi:hypothetical protein
VWRKSWKVGKLESWKVGELESWRVGEKVTGIRWQGDKETSGTQIPVTKTKTFASFTRFASVIESFACRASVIFGKLESWREGGRYQGDRCTGGLETRPYKCFYPVSCHLFQLLPSFNSSTLQLFNSSTLARPAGRPYIAVRRKISFTIPRAFSMSST